MYHAIGIPISNVYAKGSGSEKSKYNLDQKSNNKLKTTTDEDAIVDEDATAAGNITGTLGFVNPFLQFSVDTNGIPVFQTQG